MLLPGCLGPVSWLPCSFVLGVLFLLRGCQAHAHAYKIGSMSPILHLGSRFEQPHEDSLEVTPRVLFWCFQVPRRGALVAPLPNAVPWPRCAHGPGEDDVPITIYLIQQIWPVFQSEVWPHAPILPFGDVPIKVKLQALHREQRKFRDEQRNEIAQLR